MKQVNQSLEAHLNTVTNIMSYDLYELVLFNGNHYYYADTDKDIIYNGQIYNCDSLLLKRQQVKINARVVVDSMSVTIHAGKTDRIEGKSLFEAAHDGTMDRAKLFLKRCFFNGSSIIGAIDLFGGTVEVKSAGGIKLSLLVKAKTQGLNMGFPIRRYYPQGSYTTSANGVTYSKETDSGAVIAPFVPLKEVLL